MRKYLWVLPLLVVIGLLMVLAARFGEQSPMTSDAAPSRDVAFRVKCAELRSEFFSECQQTMTRQQCEALYGQTRGQLFEGKPELPFNRQLNCSGE